MCVMFGVATPFAPAWEWGTKGQDVEQIFVFCFVYTWSIQVLAIVSRVLPEHWSTN